MFLLFLLIIFCSNSLLPMESYLSDFGEDFILRAEVNGKEKCCELGSEFFKSIYDDTKTLKSDDPDCFKSSFIRDEQKALAKLKELGGESITVKSKKFQDIYCTFFDRKSDSLLVVGVGYPVPRYKMLPLAKLFPNYDLLFFDYRGIGADHHPGKASFLLPWKWKGLLSWYTAKIDFNVSSIGAVEAADVISVVEYFQNLKVYRNTFALGFCFSSYVFSEVQKERSLFDKLIFDGSWPSVERVVKTIIKCPSLVCSVENPRSPVPCMTYNSCFQSFVVKLFEWAAWVNVKMPPMSEYLSEISCPVLFFQSLKDCYCNKEEFEELWSATTSPRVAILTNNLHGRNHVWQAEAYGKIARYFLERSYSDFVEGLMDL